MPAEQPLFENATPAWKQEVNQRLAAHKQRKGGVRESLDEQPGAAAKPSSPRAAELAAKVAARYAKAPSYSDMLAGEARAAARAAGHAAAAARHAQAAAEAVLAGIESESQAQESFWNEQPEARPAQDAEWARAAEPSQSRWQDEPPAAPGRAETPWAGAQPRWEEALPQPGRDVWSEMRVQPARHASHGPYAGQQPGYSDRANELLPYDTHDATVEPVQHLPANLIEFPRELVATRKARPRQAEGPYYTATEENSQLSIFEVDPELLAAAATAEAVAPPEWASIELDHPPARHVEHEEAIRFADPAPLNLHTPEVQYHEVESREPELAHAGAAPLAPADAYVETAPAAPARYTPEARTTATASEQAYAAERARSTKAAALAPAVAYELLVAPVADRMLAAVVDTALVTLAFLAAAVVVIASTAHPPTGKIALIASCFGLVVFGLLYQFLFLSFAEEGTPGMRYARIALCTFEDDNPTVAQMRMRIPAAMAAVLPAGLGLVWALWDGDHLGWHDRLTRTYQRKY